MTDPGPRTIRLVLDTTAATSWVRGSLAVGELIAMIDDEQGAVVLPLQCLIEAAHLTVIADRPRLELLVDHPAVYVLVDDAEQWRMLAATRTIVGRADLASAAAFAVDCEVDVLTRDARWYAGINGGRDVLEFED